MTATAIRNSFKCQKCKRTFDTKAGLGSHMRSTHKIDAPWHKQPAKSPSFFHATIKCPHCPAMFKRKTGLGSHMRLKHGVVGTSHTALAYQRNKNTDSPQQPVQEMLPTLEQTADAGTAETTMTDSSENKNSSNPFACEVCGETFTYAAILGRHRRFSHGILGRAAQKLAARNAPPEDAPKRRGRPPGPATTTKPHQIQPIERATPHVQRFDNGNEDHATLNPLAYAVAVGSIQEFCRHFAEEHDIPTRQFTRQCAELFLRQTRR